MTQIMDLNLKFKPTLEPRETNMNRLRHDSTINVEVGVSAPITKSLDVRLTAFDAYDNRPAAGRLPNDLKVMAGIGFKL